MLQNLTELTLEWEFGSTKQPNLAIDALAYYVVWLYIFSKRLSVTLYLFHICLTVGCWEVGRDG